jgi:hypothetical protein
MSRTSQPDFEEGTLNAYMVRGNEVQPGDRYGYKIVAVINEGWNGWAAYRGPTTWSDEKVAANGDAISKEAAEALFSTLAATGRIYSP